MERTLPNIPWREKQGRSHWAFDWARAKGWRILYPPSGHDRHANLVVNTDVDQVIVVHSGHKGGELPIIDYQSGGLENPAIRKQVCTFFEGGEKAFKERARRLRLTL